MTVKNKREWMVWHLANPDMQKAFDALCFRLIKTGRTHYGAQGIVEVIRYHRTVEGDDGFKLNNNHSPYMGREFMKRYPKYNKFFTMRESGGRVSHGSHDRTEIRDQDYRENMELPL